MQNYTLASYNPHYDKEISHATAHEPIDDKEEEKDSLVEQFFNTTTISVVTNVKRRNGFMLKFIWVVVTSIGIAIVSYQSYGLIYDFLQCKVKESKVFLEEQYVPFPSVTVCDLNPLNWTYLQQVNHNIYQEVSRFSAKESFNVTDAVVIGFLKLGAQERQQLIQKSERFDPTASFPPDYNLNASWYHDPYLGQCVTFNSLFGEDGLAALGKCHTMAMHLKIPICLTDRIPNYHHHTVGYLLVHPRNSPPTFGVDNFVRLYPYDKVTIKVEQTIVSLTSDRECIKCLTEEEKKIQEAESVFYIPGEREYSYNTKSCVVSRARKFQMEVNNCLDRFTHLGLMSNETIGEKRLCRSSPRMEIDPPCLSPCEEIYLVNHPTRWSKLIDNSMVSRLPACCNFSENSASWDDDEIDDEYDTETMDIIVKIYQIKGYEHVTKSQTYSLWDLLGIIGGNVGLWLGISVLNLWEVIELGYMMASRKVKHYVRPTSSATTVTTMKKNGNSPSRNKAAAITGPSNYKTFPMQTKVTHIYHLQSSAEEYLQGVSNSARPFSKQ